MRCISFRFVPFPFYRSLARLNVVRERERELCKLHRAATHLRAAAAKSSSPFFQVGPKSQRKREIALFIVAVVVAEAAGDRSRLFGRRPRTASLCGGCPPEAVGAAAHVGEGAQTRTDLQVRGGRAHTRTRHSIRHDISMAILCASTRTIDHPARKSRAAQVRCVSPDGDRKCVQRSLLQRALFGRKQLARKMTPMLLN